ncbi:hypothetical protein BH11MYX2_BH11MYX2_08620 [soil metagenome]
MMRSMYCLAFVALAFLGAACGTSPDERPVTIEEVSLGILAPTCGQVQCHSTTTRTAGYAFDTLAASKKALLELTQDTAARSKLIEVMRESGGSRMPPDSPLAEEDITLIETWIDAGRKGL